MAEPGPAATPETAPEETETAAEAMGSTEAPTSVVAAETEDPTRKPAMPDRQSVQALGEAQRVAAVTAVWEEREAEEARRRRAEEERASEQTRLRALLAESERAREEAAAAHEAQLVTVLDGVAQLKETTLMSVAQLESDLAASRAAEAEARAAAEAFVTVGGGRGDEPSTTPAEPTPSVADADDAPGYMVSDHREKAAALEVLAPLAAADPPIYAAPERAMEAVGDAALARKLLESRGGSLSLALAVAHLATAAELTPEQYDARLDALSCGGDGDRILEANFVVRDISR